MDATTRTEALTLPLTTDDVKALRKADKIVFGYVSGQSTILASKERKTDGFDDPLRRIIYVDTSITDYERERRNEGSHVPLSERQYTCFESFSSAQYTEVWQTLAQILRAGDMVALHWIAANNTMTLDEDRLAHDELQLVVKREPNIKWTFNVEDRITPTHSTARMIRRM